MKESPPTKYKSTQKHQAGASKPFSLNPTGTLSRRHFAQFVSAIDSERPGSLFCSVGVTWRRFSSGVSRTAAKAAPYRPWKVADAMGSGCVCK